MNATECFFPVLRRHSRSSGCNFSVVTSSKKRKRNSRGEGNKSAAFNLQEQFPDTVPSNMPKDDEFAATGILDVYEEECSVQTSNDSDRSPDRIGMAGILTELESLRPPLRVATDQSSGLITTGYRQQHLRALMAVMHRSMLEANYPRAGRAWGALLRAETSGHSFDLRTGDRWGVGAEILLQSNRVAYPTLMAEPGKISDTHCTVHVLKSVFSPDGFAIVKEYYERLILQYPYRKTLPNITNPLKFYPAMFSAWIKSIIDQRILMERVLETSNSKKVGGQDPLSDESESGRDSTSPLNRPTKEYNCRQIRMKTLSRAYEVAERLASLTSSPPYSDITCFWKLSGMVAQWIADLHLEGLPLQSRDLPFKRYHQITGEDWENLGAGNVSPSKDENTDVAGLRNAALRARQCFGKASLSG